MAAIHGLSGGGDRKGEAEPLQLQKGVEFVYAFKVEEAGDWTLKVTCR